MEFTCQACKKKIGQEEIQKQMENWGETEVRISMTRTVRVIYSVEIRCPECGEYYMEISSE